jgi:hypothetical protein
MRSRPRGQVVTIVGVASLAVLGACSTPGVVTPATTARRGVTTTTAAPASSVPVATTTPTPTASTQPTSPCGHPGPPPVRYDHVVWIWMENHSVDAVLGLSAPTPFEHQLAAACGSGTAYRAVGSPSLPNYIAATSGGTNGIHDDAAPSAHRLDTDNLFRLVRAAGGTARSYEEAMAATCQLDNSGRYAVKHNPQAYYVNPSDRAACQQDDVPLGDLTGGALVTALAANVLPTFTFITPDLCHDTHDCGVADGDRWLQDWVTPILASPAYRSGGTAVFVVWDEPTPMPVLVISPTTPAATTSAVAFDHYSLLRTTEELLGLGPLLGRAAAATSMRTEFGM